MTTSLQTDPRRTARDSFRKPGRPPLEMPVLFQLADLSLTHVKVAALSQPHAEAQIAEPVNAAPSEVNEELTLAKVPVEVNALKEDARTLVTAAVEAPDVETAKTESQPELAISLAVTDAARHAALIEVQPRAEAPIPSADEKSAELAAIPIAASGPSVTDITPPTEVTAPSPRERTQQRSKNRQAGSGNGDWMRTHGKYIAVVFVFALIATIYIAQNGDEPSPAHPAAAAGTKSESETKTPGETEAKVTDAHAAQESVPVAHHNHSPSLLDESSPAAGNPAAEAHAELHAPQGGHTIKEPAQSTEVADSKSLFPWKEAGETRVASKPEGKRAKSPADSKGKGLGEDVQETAPVGESPAEEVPSVYGPPTQQIDPPGEQTRGEGPQLNGPSGYPVTDPNRFRGFEPPPSSAAPAQPPVTAPRATPASYQPGSPNNALPSRTSGPRYERTGSGLY